MTHRTLQVQVQVKPKKCFCQKCFNCVKTRLDTARVITVEEKEEEKEEEEEDISKAGS